MNRHTISRLLRAGCRFTAAGALAGLLVAAALAAGAATAAAQPRYADKETALDLAQALDKGIYRNSLISSTFIQSVEPDAYTIKVVLENGGEQNWDLRQVRTWAKNDLLTLSRNRVLVFPHTDNNAFGVLDKNAFAQAALRARVYAKHYEEPDILAGQVIHFSVMSFNLVDLLDLAPGRDELGYVYRYVLDLENGQRELLTYLDAWRIMQSGALMEAPGSAPVLRTPYRLQTVRARSLERIEEGGIGRFGLELVFDRPVALQPAHYPFRLYEARERSPGSLAGNRFVIEFTAPNAVLEEAPKPIEHLEFLNDIRAVADPEHTNRVLLRANIAPDVLSNPPTVDVAGSVVDVTFTKVVDQSVFDREDLRQAELRHRQERALAGSLSDEEIERRQLYQQHMETGSAQLDRARAVEAVPEQLDVLQVALSNFREAAINASSDQQLEEALRQRNKLLVRIPRTIVKYVRGHIESGSVDDADALRELLRTAGNLTRDPQMLDVVGKLARDLEAAR